MLAIFHKNEIYDSAAVLLYNNSFAHATQSVYTGIKVKVAFVCLRMFGNQVECFRKNFC